jgi:undecaprenyl-diphosphatase
MDLLQAMVLGLIEGVTEFLPVSSTGHMIVAGQWLGVAQNGDNKAFEVIIQLAAILAVVAYDCERFTPTPGHIELWKKVILAFIPVGIVGLLLHTQIKAMFTLHIVAVMFIVGGIVFLLVEFLHRGREYAVHRVEDISYRQAMWIGIAQVFALIPGTSRAGATIIGALLVEVDRKTSAEFSFLLAVPVMLAASGFDLVRHLHDFAGAEFAPLLAGFVVAFASAWVVIRLFISFLQRFTFVPFGIYRILFGILLLWLAH